MRVKAGTKAGLLYLLPTVTVCGIWYVLLAADSSPTSSAGATLMFVLSDGPNPYWFRWLVALPVLCLVLCVAYLSRVSATRVGSACLFAAGLALSTAIWLTVAHEVALFATLPLLHGFLNAKHNWRVTNNGP